MRIPSTLLLIIVCLQCFSQNYDKGSAIIEYQNTNNTERPNSLYTTLSIEGHMSIFQEKYSTREFGQVKETPGVTTVFSKNDFDPYLKTDLRNKEILFYEKMGQNIFLIKDSFTDLNWEITSETKEIAGYNCIKAIAPYRGRIWQAWFTQEIALPFGPWKLHGLPGLILEASDTTDRYSFKVVKIEFKKSELFKKDFNSLMRAYNKKPVNYQQFLADKEESSNNLYKEVSQDKNINIERHKPPLPNGMETKFEWEQ